MKRMLLFLFMATMLVGTFGCTKIVPPGYKGQIKNVSGWSKELVEPGRHSCWGRDEMWLVETRDLTKQVSLNILLQEEQVNFGVDVNIKFCLKDDAASVLPLFDKVRPSGKSITEGDNTYDKIITLDNVFDTYAKLVVESVPRNLIRARTTKQILADTEAMERDVQSGIIEDLIDSPIAVSKITLSNMDFPDFITAAQERAMEAEVKIREEQNRQKMRIVEAENKKKLAEIDYQIAQLEAKKVADQNRLIGESLMGEAGDRYLRYHEIKVYGNAADGPNNTILLPMNFTGFGNQRMNIQHEAIMTPIREELRDAMLKKND